MKYILLSLLAFAGVFTFASSGLHAQSEASEATIGATLAEEGTASTLLAALDAAELTSTLKAEGDFVLLAPTNDAFAALPKGTVQALLQPENAAVLRELLMYHLVPDAEGAPTTAAAGKLRDTEATATRSLDCTNGTVYLIDRVLLPPDLDLSAL